jgi:hypothetical protein
VAPAAKGVTNGDSHDHNGGDGAQIAYANLSGLPTLGTAAAAATSDFAAASHNQAETTITFTDVTTGNASTAAHGYAPKATAPASGLVSVLAIANGETVRSDKALFDTTNPAALGSVGPGTAVIAARRDHGHAMPSAANVGAASATSFIAGAGALTGPAAPLTIGTAAGKTAPSGDVVGTTDTQTLTNKTITGFNQTRLSVSITDGTLTLDCATANFFVVALNAAILVQTFSNVPASGTAYTLTLALVADGTARAVTWGSAVKWPGGTAPTLTATNFKRDLITMTTWDGGSNWYAAVVGQDY